MESVHVNVKHGKNLLTSVTLEPRFMFPRSLSLPAWVMAKLSPDYCHSLLLTMSDEEKRKFLRTLEERPRLPARSQHPRHPLGQVPQRQLPLRAPQQRLQRVWRVRIKPHAFCFPSKTKDNQSSRNINLKTGRGHTALKYKAYIVNTPI